MYRSLKSRVCIPRLGFAQGCHAMPTVNFVRNIKCEGDGSWFGQTWHLTAWNHEGQELVNITRSYGSGGQANIDKIKDFCRALIDRGYILTKPQIDDIFGKMGHGQANVTWDQYLEMLGLSRHEYDQAGRSFDCRYSCSQIWDRGIERVRPVLGRHGYSC